MSLEGEVQKLISSFFSPLRGLPEAWWPGRGRKEKKKSENSEAEDEILRRY